MDQNYCSSTGPRVPFWHISHYNYSTYRVCEIPQTDTLFLRTKALCETCPFVQEDSFPTRLRVLPSSEGTVTIGIGLSL